MQKLLLIILGLMLAVKSYAEPCVKIRDGSNGNGSSAGYICMKFNEAERRIASEFHVQMASPYKTVFAQLSHDGWNQKQNKEPPDSSIQIDQYCGHGLDAVCEIQMTKATSSILLTFSATNEGTPLIAIEKLP